MKQKINRRDFLKLAGLLPLGLAAPRFLQTSPDKKNILIIVFDALSAYNIPLYGYSRQTTPNLSKLAERAIVYNRHYAGGNFTTTGTASLLTGTNPWTHRALQHNSLVAEAVAAHNIFNVFQNYHRIGYTQNSWANVFLRQFQKDLEEWIPRERLLLGSYGRYIQNLFAKDGDLASVSWTRAVNSQESGYAYSLFFSHLYESLQKWKMQTISAQFPRGIPNAGYDNQYLLEEAIDALGEHTIAAPQPFFGYFHFLPPHSPYNTTIKFFNQFNNDGFVPVQKPLSAFSEKKKSNLLKYRAEYDEFILYADEEFGRFWNKLEDAGLLENTVIAFTSDHGEINERGISGHTTNALYEPLTRVPLLIFDPGRKTRLDVNTPTSAIDLLPTLLRLADKKIPDWAEGIILPPFNATPPDSDRSVYTLRAVYTEQDKPIDNYFSAALVKGRYKLHYYAGYEEINGGELIQLFDVESDPEEMLDLSVTHKEIANKLLAELKTKLAEVNKPYL